MSSEKKLINEELQELEEYGALMMPIEEIAIIMGLDTDLLAAKIKDKDSEISQAYYRGYLKSKAEVRKSVLMHAKSGSGPAQQMAEGFVKELNIEREKYG